MRKVVSLMLSLVLTASLLTGCSDNKTSSNGEVIVYNWGEYIDPEVITQFEEETGIKVIYYDFSLRDGFTLLEGSNTLNASIKNESPISRVKYVNNNSILTDNTQNRIFKKFIDFVDRMLLFYSLDSRGYEGFSSRERTDE